MREMVFWQATQRPAITAKCLVPPGCVQRLCVPSAWKPSSSLGRHVESAAVDAATDQNRPLARMIGRADDAFLFHPLNEGSGFVIADG